MSRIGKEPITIPDGVKVAVEDGVFLAEGPKGKVSQALVPEVSVEVDGGVLTVVRHGESRNHRARHGLMRALMANAVKGVAEGWAKELEIHGVGYKAENVGREIHLALGYSHPVVYQVPRRNRRGGRHEGQSHQDPGCGPPEGRPGGCGDSQPAQAGALQGQGHQVFRRGDSSQGRQGRSLTLRSRRTGIMDIAKTKRVRRVRAHQRIRRKVWGTAERPRLAVYKSTRYVYAQLINDDLGHTLAEASSREGDIAKKAEGSGSTRSAARLVGETVAERAKASGVDKVVFDRGGYIYHGKVKELAEGARAKGLDF